MIAPDGSEWLTIAEAAKRARVREDLIRQWKKRRHVAAHRIGGRVLVKLADVYHMEAKWRRRIGVSCLDMS